MTNSIQSALASGSRKIGFLTWYDCRNVNITPTSLKAVFDKHGLSEVHLPDTIKPKNAFQKACRKAMVDINVNSDNRRSITKLIADGMDKIIYGVVDLNVHEQAESIDPDFSDKVWLDKNNLCVQYEKGHHLSKNIVDIFVKLCGEYTTRDISRMIVRALDHMASISLRDGGVIYFVPVGFEADLLALQKVVNDLGECNMRVFALGSDDRNSSKIEDAAKSQITDKIDSMKGDIKDLKESIESGRIKGGTIDNSIEVRRKRFNDLKVRCQILSDALKIKADVLEGNLSEVENLINQELEVFIGTV